MRPFFFAAVPNFRPVVTARLGIIVAQGHLLPAAAWATKLVATVVLPQPPFPLTAERAELLKFL